MPRGRGDAAARHAAEARTLLPALVVAAIAGLFERSRVWPLWRREVAGLAGLELPAD